MSGGPARSGATLLDRYDHDRALIFGIGNIGRQDDGLGWAFVDWIEDTGRCPAAATVRNYQLSLEDADAISRVERVLFVDSTKDPSVVSFEISRPAPKLDVSFTSHAMSIPALMSTCLTCFGYLPEVSVLAIRGYCWELEVGLSQDASVNLAAATAFVSSTPTVPQSELVTGRVS